MSLARFGINGTPGSPPPTGYMWLYMKSDKLLYFMDDTGTELPVKPTGGGTGDLLSDGSVPLTANWDVGAFNIIALGFESDVATGTPPLVVASTTLVTNLNADKIDGADLIDEDDMVSDSATAVPTQQSVKAYVDASSGGGIAPTLFDANTILKADADDTPVALTVAEQTLLGRITAGSITALTASEVRTLLNVADGSIANVVEDTTPQLGGSLDVNGQKIASVSNGNIDIEPHGTGNVLLGNFVIDADATIGAGQDNFVLTYDHASGTWGPESGGGGGGSTFADNVFRVQDNGDATKQIALEASGIATATTRTITMPNADVSLTGNGTSFPASPPTGSRYFRTDLGMEFYYNGTRWLSTQRITIPISNTEHVAFPYAASVSVAHRATFGNDFDLWLEYWNCTSNVLTTNNGTNYWRSEMRKIDHNTGSSVLLVSFDTSADSTDLKNKQITINAVLGTASGYRSLYTTATKTLSPGDWRFTPGFVVARYIGT